SEGQRVGVFVGASHNNYMEHHVRGIDLARLQQFDSFTALPPAQRTALLEEWRLCFGEPGAQPNTAVDNLLNMIAARTSHALNLKGPSLAIDTACSSSLVALHLACESLRRGECEMALAGGVNLNLSPTPYLLFARAGTLSPHGRCKVFDEDADGFVPGEGVGTVVLKPLARAQADGDAVLAVIKRSVVNNDGRSLGVMAPNPDGQRVAIAGVYREGGLNDLSPAHIQYLEAHGTGTAIGDPSELRSLAEVFNDVPRASCVVGSVKANVGHLLSAAGIASFIKLVLMLQHKRMPPSLHVQRPTAQLRDAQTPFRLLENAEHWHAPENMPRRGAINSFGFGGTNCHMVLEEAPAPHLSSAAEPPAHVLCVSAHSEDALRQRALDLARCLTQPAFGDSPLSPLSPVDAAHWRAVDVCHSSNAGRSHFAHRLAVVSDTLEGLAEKLATAQPSLAQRPEVALMFTGQGSQYPGMAQRLYETLPAFRAHLDACAAAFAPYLDLPLTDSLYGAAASAEALAQTRLTQPVVFAIDYAMGRVLMDWGVKPACLMGHSVGEYAAAALAGVMSLADAAKIVAARGRLINALPAGGGMAALFDSHEAVAKWIEPYAGRLWFAAHNGHQQVVSGERAALEALQTELQAHAKVCRLLQVSHAFHTPLLAPMLEEFAQVLAQVQFAPPQVPIVS
ncbi:MAG TPA: type I polyketide synthase, partial [Burkholderiaceae bacterium]|nr:type I polyketide synthase [Burkholderiaceae bacterium]